MQNIKNNKQGDKLEQLLQNCQCDVHSRNITLFVWLHQFINEYHKMKVIMPRDR